MSKDDHSYPELSTLIFPGASTAISHFHRAATRSRLTVASRLHSIAHDARFATSIGEHYGLPLVANERCGSWYVPPTLKLGSVYFKSTDGHAGQWRFSTRRLNLHLLELIAEHGGCIIVDSTRRGKSMPDALSKTLPIWIATMNRLLWPTSHSSEHILRTPPDVVSGSEHAQIEARLDRFASDAQALGVDLSGIKAKLGGEKALRPFWVTQQTSNLPIIAGAQSEEVYPIILCTASARDVNLDSADRARFDYVQGAADDAEAWAAGLTPALFWTHRDALLRCGEDRLPSLIGELILDAGGNLGPAAATTAPAPAVAAVAPAPARLIRPTDQVFVGTLDTSAHGFDCVIACCTTEDAKRFGTEVSNVLHLECQPGKLGSRALRHALPKLVERVDKIIQKEGMAVRLLAVCPGGRDHSIGVALTLLCLFVDDEGKLRPRRTSVIFTKDSIRQRLSWIMIEIPEANPSRATLQSVNAFLLGDRG